jgi:hypothetical protein
MPQAGFQLLIYSPKKYWPDKVSALLGYSYNGARNDTTKHSGQTPDKEVEIKNITVYVSGNKFI